MAIAAVCVAATHGFTFPYVIDETQDVARTYGAQCTPDFFGFNAQDELQYHGRLDASRMPPIANARRDLFEAMKQVVETGHGPAEQIPSMGSSCQSDSERHTGPGGRIAGSRSKTRMHRR